MLRVGIVGCGKIADSHATQIRRIPGAKIVGACDHEPLMVEQFCDRFGVEGRAADFESLVSLGLDVVHITTPAASHAPLARLALESGVAAYVEKPLTLTASEAEELVALSVAQDVPLTVGHDDQFTHASRRVRDRISRGVIGPSVEYMECYYCYDFAGSYGRSIVKDPNHWVRRLPGMLFQNILSHGIARIAEYLNDDIVHASGDVFRSRELEALGENQIFDELRFLVRDSRGCSAVLVVGSGFQPTINQFRVFGSKGALAMDHDKEWVIRLRGKKLPSYADKFIPSTELAIQFANNLVYNAKAFLRSDFHMKNGMKSLIEGFYAHIEDRSVPAPIPHQEITRGARLMDEVVKLVRKNL